MPPFVLWHKGRQSASAAFRGVSRHVHSPDSFSVLAEISIALIGFAGVVVALGRSKLAKAEQEFRLRLLFVNGATSLWGGLTPTVASLVIPNHQWLLSGLLFAPVLLTVNIYAWFNFFRLIRARSIMPIVFYVVTPFSLVALLWLLYGMLFDRGQIPGAQFIASTLVLFLGVYHFFVLTISGASSDA